MMKNDSRTAYFAGLFDGEATIAAYPRKGQSHLRPCVKLNMTCKETMEAVAAHFGGKIMPKKVASGNKPQWHWFVGCNQALDVIDAVRPYLITKAAGADRVLATCQRGVRGRKRIAP